MGWRDLFRRQPPAPPPPPSSPSTDDKAGETDRSWKAGDMAECVVGGAWFTVTPFGLQPSSGPQSGEVRVVAHVTMSSHPFRGEAIFLHFARYGGQFEAACFRKLTPQADKAQRADADFLPFLKKWAPRPERVS